MTDNTRVMKTWMEPQWGNADAQRAEALRRGSLGMQISPFLKGASVFLDTHTGLPQKVNLVVMRLYPDQCTKTVSKMN